MRDPGFHGQQIVVQFVFLFATRRRQRGYRVPDNQGGGDEGGAIGGSFPIAQADGKADRDVQPDGDGQWQESPAQGCGGAIENASGRVAGFGDLVEGGRAEQHGNRCQDQEQCHAIEQAPWKRNRSKAGEKAALY